MPKPLKYKEVWKRLRRYSKRFEEHTRRAKGSHRMIYHPELGEGKQPASCPIPFHGGKDVSKGVLRSIIRAFNLPKDIFY